MRLNKAGQYGMLLSLYLSRAGRARIEDIAVNLNLSKHFLEQIASKLRRAGVVVSVRGPGGGYELNPQASVYEVLTASGVQGLLNSDESAALQTGTPEQRALGNFVGAVSYQMSTLLNVKVSHVSDALVQQEVAQLDSINETATAN